MDTKQDPEAATQGHGIKSILKARSKPSKNGLRVKTSNASSVGSKSSKKRSISQDAKKKVEITTPSHSLTSVKEQRQPARSSVKDTPLPRVAMLPPRPSNLDKLRPKPKTFFAHKESTLKRSGASTSPYSRSKQAPASASTSKIKAKPVTSATSQSQVGGAHTTTSPSPKRSKSGKKLRKKKKSKSASDVRSSSEEDGGKQYIKELVTINELLKSVTDPSNRVNPEVPLIEGFVRPFSAMELNQLLKSVGKVATIHKDPANLVPKTEEDETKPKIPVGEQTEVEALADALAEKPSKKKKKRKNKKSPRSKSSTSTISSKHSKTKEKPEPLPIPATGSASKNLASKKTLKSNVKTVKVKTKISGGKKDSVKKQSKEDLESELSELDLVKSALLNKRYYEESLALQVAPVAEDSKNNKNPPKNKNTKELKKRSKAAHSSAQALLSRSPSPTKRQTRPGKGQPAASQNPGVGVTGRTSGPLPLPPLTPKDMDDAYNKALGNVLINYSHVIRPSSRRGVEHVSSKPKLEHRGVAEILESVKTPKFEKQLQNLKYGGTVERGMLDIDHVKVPQEAPHPGKQLSASKLTSPIGEGGQQGIVPPSILVKDRHRESSEGTSKSKSRRRGRKSRSRSRSRSPARESKPATAPVVGFNFARPEKKVHNSTRADTTANRHSPLIRSSNQHGHPKTQRNNLLKLEPPIVSLVKARPTSRWNEQSIAPSLFSGLPDSGASRWAILNEKVLERNRELKADKEKKMLESQRGGNHGRGGHPQEVEGRGRSTKQRDPMEEKRIFLKNLDRATKAFDEFGVHDNVMGKKFGRDQHVKIDEAFGHLDSLVGKHRT